MKKSILMKLLVLAVCAAMLLSLFACGPEVETEPTEEPTQQETEKPTDGADDKTTEAPTQAGGEDTDPAETDPAETDPAETDPVETDPVETDPVETDPVETDPVETDPVETDPVETDPVETDPAETDPVVETKPVETDPEVETNPVETDPACDGNHNYVAKGASGHYCDKCGVPGKNNPIIKHEYEDKDGVPTCSVCGFEADCKGVHTAYNGDENGHWTAPCPDCGAAAGTEVSDHTYEYANDKYACTVCGWTLTCDGKHGLVSAGADGHQTAACPICNVPAGEIVAHEFANSVCACGYEAACKGTHKVVADDEGHEIDDCDICGYKSEGKAAHTWGTEYYTAGSSYVYGCTECGYAKYTKVLTDKVSAFITTGNMYYNKQDVEKTDLTSSTKYQIDTGFVVDEATGMPYMTISGTKAVSQFLWNRAVADCGSQSSKPEQYTFDVGNAKYLVIKARAAFTSGAKITLEYSTAGVDGKSGISIPFVASETPEWVTYVIDLNSASLGKHVKAEGAETYVVDTFYFHMEPFKAEDTLDIAYMAFVEGDWADIGAFVDEESVVAVVNSGVGSFVNPDTGVCVGEHAASVTVVDGEYKTVCGVCGFVKSSYGIKEDGPNKLWAAEKLAVTGGITGYLDKELCYDEDGTAYVRYDNYWPNRDNWGDFSINIPAGVGSAASTGQYLVIKLRVGNAGTGSNSIQVFANTNQSGTNGLVSQGEVAFAKTNDNEWHTVVIDLANRVKTPSVAFLPDEDQTYNVRYLSIRAFSSSSTVASDEADGQYFYTYFADGTYKEQVLGKENRLTAEQMTEKGYTSEKIHKCTVTTDAYVDISYVALCDSIDDIKNIVTAETYEWSIDNTTNALRNTADNGCAAHTYREVVEETTHKIQCTTCEYVLRSYTVSADINYYADLGSMNYFTNAGTGLTKLHIDPVAGVLYNSFYATQSTHWNLTGGAGAGNPTSAKYNSGEYVVMKVRVSEGAAKTSMSLYLSTDGTTNTAAGNIGTFTVEAEDGWVVVVAKIGELTTYKANTEAKLYFMGMPGQDRKLDVAYLAVVDSIEEMKTLLDEGETYVYYGESFSNAGVEYDQAGNKVPCRTCVVDAPVITDGENGEKTYTYICVKCGNEFAKTIDASVVKYYTPNNLITDAKQYYSTNGAGSKSVIMDGDVPTSIFNNYRQLIYMRDNGDLGQGQSAVIEQKGSFSIGNAQYAVIKFRSEDAAAWLSLSLSFEGRDGEVAVAEENLVGSGYHHPDGTQDTWKDAEDKDVSGVLAGSEYIKNNGYWSLSLMKRGTADGEWVTAVIDLAKAYEGFYAKAEGAEDYVVDYLVIDLAGEVEIAYLGFVDGDMSKAYALAENGKVRIVNDTEGGYDIVDLDAAMGTESFPERLEELDYTTNDVVVEEGNKDGYFYTYTAIHDGTVTLYFNSWAMEEGVEGEIIVTNTTTGEVKKLSVDGVDNYGMELTVAVNEGDVLLIQVISVDSEDAEANPAATLSWTGNFKYPVGHENNPVIIEWGWDDEYVNATATFTVAAGATVYFNGQAGMILTVDGVVTEMNDDGVFAITNNGDADAEYALALATPVGAYNNPEVIEDNNFSDTTSLEEDGAYNYIISVTENGKLILTVTDGANITVDVLTYVDGEEWPIQEQFALAEPVIDETTWDYTGWDVAEKLVIDVVAGQQVKIQVNALTDWASWTSPAIDYTFNATFFAEHTCVSDAAFACVDGKCVTCGEVVAAAGEHTEPDNGYCTVCGTKIGYSTVVSELAINSSTPTDKPDDKMSVTWSDENVTVFAAGETAYKNTDLMKGYFWIPVGFTVSVRGSMMTKVVITATNADYADALANDIVIEGATVTVEGNDVVITVDNGATLDEIAFTITAKTRINNIAVSYLV